MSMLGFKLSENVVTTIDPPIQDAWAWAEDFPATPERPLIDVSQGSPASPPPSGLLKALGDAGSHPENSKYSIPKGYPDLIRSVIEEMKNAYGEDIDLEEADIAITAGCNMAYFAALKTIADAGDEVIVPVPWYFSHQMTNDLLGIKTIPLPTYAEDGFLPSPNQAATLVTPKTRAIILVSPNNPTGAVYPPPVLASFAALARDRRIALILDETYRDFILPGPPHELFTSSSFKDASADRPPRPFLPPTSSGATPDVVPPNWNWRRTLIHLFSFSKSYHLPGHRVGLIAAHPEFVTACIRVLDCMQICAPRPVQAALAGPGVLSSLRPFVKEGAETLVARHKFFKENLPRGWYIGAQGAYYAFVRHPFANRGAEEVCKRLASEVGLVALPIQFFSTPEAMKGMYPGWERWIRFSVANVGEDQLRELGRRLEEAVKEWGWELDI